MNKNLLTLAILALFTTSSAFAQWCTPQKGSKYMNSYGANSPVITNVKFNTINRTSSSSLPELYLYTKIGTSVKQGSSHTFSMSWTRDTRICNEQNIRVWIDWNLDGDFKDAGELAATLSNTAQTTMSATISVPATAKTGTTRMRVAMKMTPPCGHTLPDPCVPSESVGWHGEIEDYDLTVTGANNVEEVMLQNAINLFPNPTEGILNVTNTSTNAITAVNVFNVLGESVITQRNITNTLDFTNLDKGMYFVQISTDKATIAQRIIVK